MSNIGPVTRFRYNNIAAGAQGPQGIPGPAGPASYAYTPAQSYNWRTVPSQVPNALDALSNSPAGRFVFTRDFCPVSLLPYFANLQGNAPHPYLLSTGFANLAAAEAAFPLSTTAGDLNSDSYSTNSLDWAVVNEAIRYSEANSMPTVWLDHPISSNTEGAAYGIVGTFTIHGGVKIRGQGSSGSNFSQGTSFIHFSTDDLFVWDGTADPSGVGNYSAGTGGGLYHVTIAKADRTNWGGSTYQGGKAIYLQANALSKRPGQMIFHDLLVTAEAYNATSNWAMGLHGDGTKVTSYGAEGVRDVQIHSCRFGSATTSGKTVYIQYCAHWSANGLQVQNDPAGSNAGITIEGGSEDIHLHPIQAYGSVNIVDRAATNISAATNASPIVVTSASHGFPVGDTPYVQISGVTGNTAANGLWVATILTSNTMSLGGSTGNSSYVSGGTVTSISPNNITIQGRASGYSCTAVNSDGNVCLASGFVTPSTSGYSSASQPTIFQGELFATSASPWLRFDGPHKPCFGVQLFNATRANVTGDGTVYPVVHNNLDFDHNDDFHGFASTYTSWTCAVAGTYRFRGRVTFSGVTSAVTSLETQLHVNYASGGLDRYATAFAQPSGNGTNCTVEVTQTFQLLSGDTVTLNAIGNGTTKTLNVIGDSASGLTMLSGELV